MTTEDAIILDTFLIHFDEVVDIAIMVDIHFFVSKSIRDHKFRLEDIDTFVRICAT